MARGEIFKVYGTTDTYPVTLLEPAVYIAIRNADAAQTLDIIFNTHLKGDIHVKVGPMEAFDGPFAAFSSFNVVNPTVDFNIALGGA